MIKDPAIPQIKKEVEGQFFSATNENIKSDIIKRTTRGVKPPQQLISPARTTSESNEPISGLWLGTRDTSNTLLISEVDIETFEMKPSRWIHAPGKFGGDLGGGKRFFFHLDTGQQKIYEYDAKTMCLTRIFIAARGVGSTSKQPFPDLPFMLGRAFAVGAKDDIFVLAGRGAETNSARRFVIYKVGTAPEREITVLMNKTVTQMEAPNLETITGVGIDSTNIYVTAGREHLLFDYDVEEDSITLVKRFVDIGRGAQGAGIVNGRLYTTDVDTRGLPQIQERSITTLKTIRFKSYSILSLWGIGG